MQTTLYMISYNFFQQVKQIYENVYVHTCTNSDYVGINLTNIINPSYFHELHKKYNNIGRYIIISYFMTQYDILKKCHII